MVPGNQDQMVMKLFIQFHFFLVLALVDSIQDLFQLLYGLHVRIFY